MNEAVLIERSTRISRLFAAFGLSPPAHSNYRFLLHGKIRIISLGRDLLLPCSGKPLEFAGWLYRTGFNRPAGFCRAWWLRALCVNDLLSDTADPGSTSCRHGCRVAS